MCFVNHRIPLYHQSSVELSDHPDFMFRAPFVPEGYPKVTLHVIVFSLHMHGYPLILSAIKLIISDLRKLIPLFTLLGSYSSCKMKYANQSFFYLLASICLCLKAVSFFPICNYSEPGYYSESVGWKLYLLLPFIRYEKLL